MMTFIFSLIRHVQVITNTELNGYEKKTLFLHKNTHIQCKKNCLQLAYVFFQHNLFLFHFRGRKSYSSYRRLVYIKNSKRNNCIIHGTWRSSYVRKKWKLKEVNSLNTSRFLPFSVPPFKEITQKLLEIFWLRGKTINVIRSLSLQFCMKSILKSGKITSKQWRSRFH